MAVLGPAPATAQDEPVARHRARPAIGLPDPSPFLPSDGLVLPGGTGALDVAGTPRVLVVSRRQPALRTLETSFVALQALDAATTLRAVGHGLEERNPLMRGLVGQPAAFIAVKAGATASTIWLLRRVARQNRAAAVLTLAAINGGYAVLVARNAAALRH
jgi:hypothetical protein